MTAIRFYLQRPSTGSGILLIVERTDDLRGYRLLCSDRHHAREELPHLRRLVESIGPREVVRVYDPVEVPRVEFKAKVYFGTPVTWDHSAGCDVDRSGWGDEQP